MATGRRGVYSAFHHDTEFYNYSFWSTYNDTKFPNPTTFAVQVKKVSGAKNYAYGMVFDRINDENFSRVLITTSGSYRVDKKENGEYSRLTGDTTNNGFQSSGGAITHGYDQTNTIRVVIDSTNNTLDLFINGVTVEEDLASSPLAATVWEDLRRWVMKTTKRFRTPRWMFAFG